MRWHRRPSERQARTPGRSRTITLLGLLALLVTSAGIARAELSQSGNIRVAFDGGIVPNELPRNRLAPVAVSVSGEIKNLRGPLPPRVKHISIQVNRHGRLFDKGLPACPRKRLANSTTSMALRRCGRALVGRGQMRSAIALPDQAPLPSKGKITIFKGKPRGGKRVLLAHTYGKKPAPTTYVFVFTMRKTRGTYGTRLTTTVPRLSSNWGYLSYFAFRLKRRYHHRGRRVSYLSASCPAPNGFPRATFPLSRVQYRFEGGRRVSSTLIRSCRVR